jgi:plasmid stabilization system protein ParE
MHIFFTKRAETNYRDIKEYLTKTWGDVVTDVFEQKVSDFLTLLKDFPELGTEEVAEKQIRAFQLTRHTRVFYRLKKEKIIILMFFDVRQDPKKGLQ